MKQKKKQGLTKTQKERIYSFLVELTSALDKIDNYKYSNYDDLDYFGIKDLKNLFNDIMMMITTNQHQLKVLSKIIMNIMKLEVTMIKTYQ